MTPEHERLANPAPWRTFGPYLSERQWGTVREDYSANGEPWTYTTHDMARSYAYRWGEDGIGGISDNQQLLCFAPSFWNGHDPILKERLFGLSGPEGNHGEDVKENYYYLDNTPTHSYMRMLYKYPQHAFPYEWLVNQNARRTRQEPEFELADTAIFKENKYFDIFIEYAKAGPEDILITITAYNRGPEAAPLHILPSLWFRNTWAWGDSPYHPQIRAVPGGIKVDHTGLPGLQLHTEGEQELLFCDNETNAPRLHQAAPPRGIRYFKDGIHECVVNGHAEAVNPDCTGTRAAAHYVLNIEAGASQTIRLRLGPHDLATPFADFDQIMQQRQQEADAFYANLQKNLASADARNVQRQALAGMLWSKQYYYYDVDQWLDGDPGMPPPPPERAHGRNANWRNVRNGDIISMPDTWEYPWYAAWDLAFHAIPLAMVDPDFAKNQICLLCQDWYMHPNGQLPAYEWQFGDVNPPVHAMAAFRVFKMEQKYSNGPGDVPFLETIFLRLLLNFTWWVNRKDRNNRNIFEGGFLGLDNIGVFDRSAPLPFGGYIEQADGTAWMAMYALNMMRIALELAQTNPVYEDLASKFFEHFLSIAKAMTGSGPNDIDMWDEQDEFYYDVLSTPDQGRTPLRVRSMVGLIPIFAVEVIDEGLLEKMPRFLARMNWLLDNKPELAALVSHWQEPGQASRRLLSLLRGHRLKALLRRALDEAEFLSGHGVRSLSKYHLDNPYVFHSAEKSFAVKYEPGESETSLYGGNSNWRGPVWFPVNFMLIEGLQRFHHYYGDDFLVEYPTGSGQHLTLLAIADKLTERLTKLFLRDENGQRPCFNGDKQQQTDPHFKDYLLFHEYFHGDTGRGLGASHQTGWTGLIAKFLQPRG